MANALTHRPACRSHRQGPNRVSPGARRAGVRRTDATETVCSLTDPDDHRQRLTVYPWITTAAIDRHRDQPTKRQGVYVRPQQQRSTAGFILTGACRSIGIPKAVCDAGRGAAEPNCAWCGNQRLLTIGLQEGSRREVRIGHWGSVPEGILIEGSPRQRRQRPKAVEAIFVSSQATSWRTRRMPEQVGYLLDVGHQTGVHCPALQEPANIHLGDG
jgi:hypothetical protein